MVIMQLAFLLLGFSTSLTPVLHKTFHYGKGPEHFGIRGIKKGEPVGPYSFAIGGPLRNIYIPDPINGDIKVVSMSGTIEDRIPFEGYFDDIRVDERGNIYILDRMGERIIVLSEKGNTKQEYSLSYDDVKYPCKLKLKNNDIYIKSVNQILQNALTKSSELPLYEVSLKDDNLDIFKHENSTIKQIVSLKIKDIVSAEFLGTDRNNNIYIQAEVKKELSGVNLIVLKFDSNGHLQGRYRIPHNDYFVWTSRLLDIDEDGNIYQVLPAKDRLEINIWKAE